MGSDSVSGGNDIVLCDTREGVALVTLNRPERNNGWSDELGEAYFAKLRACDRDPSVRVIVVTGAGKSFCVGGDTAALEQVVREGSLKTTYGPRTPNWTTTTIRKPVIAAINGGCAGVGLVQALMCDIRFASDRARFSTAFAGRGLPAEQGLAWVLPRVAGLSTALDLMLSARVFDSSEARELHLVDRVFAADELQEAAFQYAATMAANCSPAAMAVIKNQTWAGLDQSFREAADWSEQLSEDMVAQPDFREGIASFIERRPATFSPLAN
jgi:enoyl-CoA hydratase/carnithine racemase